MPEYQFPISDQEIRAIAVAYDEMLSYYEVVGDEGSLDDEELPSGKIPSALADLRGLLDRFANFEHLRSQARSHHQVIEVPPVRFSVRPTPPSGPLPEVERDA